MKHIVLIISFLIIGFVVKAQGFREVKFDRVDSLLISSNDTLYVVNFWATWCKPCVAELPYFRNAAEQFQGKPVKFLFISLDFESQIDTKLVPFLKKDPLPGDVWWLNERKLQSMIDKVDKNWSGAIPFTLFLKGSPGEKSYWEGELTQEQLYTWIQENL